MELTFDEFLQVVDSIINQDQGPDALQEANNIIYQFREKNPTQFLIYSAEIILLENVSDNQATIAITFIKSILRRSRYNGIDYIKQIWVSIPEEQRMQLKQALIRGIMFPKDDLRNMASSTLAIIAQLEFPLQWPDFFTVLTTLCQDQSFGTSAVLGVLQTLCESFSIEFIRPRYTKERENVLEIICSLAFQVLQQDVDATMKELAVNMLVNSFKTTFHRIYRKNPELVETTYQHLLANFEIEDTKLHNLIYEYFLFTFKRNYEKIFPHPITEIAQAVTRDLQSGNIEFQKIALSFLRKCAKLELETSSEPTIKSENFTMTCSQNFTESIMPLLAFLDDTEDETDSLSYYTYRTLKSFATFDEENVLTNAMEYFNQNKEDEDWKVRTSAVLAFKSILGIDVDLDKEIWSAFPDIVTLCQDSNINVRVHSQGLVASLVKKCFLMEDRNKEIQFIVDFCSELLQQDVQQAIEGCKILLNFIERYPQEDISSPLGNDEIFDTILKALWSQVDRPEIQDTKFYIKVRSAICKLCIKSPYTTIETRRAFCLEVLDKFRENATAVYGVTSVSQDMASIQSLYLEIFSQAIFSIRGLLVNEESFQFIDEVFEYFSQFLPRMSEIPNLIKAIGNIIIAVPDRSKKYAETLSKYLIEAQKSRNLDLIAESSITTGDLYRSASEIMQDFSETFCALLLDNIEDDTLVLDAPICQAILTLADVVKYSSAENIISYRDRLMAVVRNYTHIKYDKDNPGEVETMTNFFEGTIYLSGAILKTFSEDQEFISNKQNMEILFEFKDHIDPAVFRSLKLDYAIILFLDCALHRQQSARLYNIFLNHINIKNYLQSIVVSGKNKDCKDRAKELLPRLLSA